MPNSNTEEQPETHPQPRRTLAEVVGEEVGAQRLEAEMDAFDAAAAEEPQWDKKTATSNLGKRLSARIQQAIRS